MFDDAVVYDLLPLPQHSIVYFAVHITANMDMDTSRRIRIWMPSMRPQILIECDVVSLSQVLVNACGGRWMAASVVLAFEIALIIIVCVSASLCVCVFCRSVCVPHHFRYGYRIQCVRFVRTGVAAIEIQQINNNSVLGADNRADKFDWTVIYYTHTYTVLTLSPFLEATAKWNWTFVCASSGCTRACV